MRSAGALFDLQKTPYDIEVNAIDANPKKTKVNTIVTHSRELFTNWPADTVIKISASPANAAMNKLELETTSTAKTPIAEAYDLRDYADIGFPGLSAVFDSINWVGGDDKAYTSAEAKFNYYEPISIDGVLTPAWDIWSLTATYNSDGSANLSYSLTEENLAPDTMGAGAVPFVLNGGAGVAMFADPNTSAWAIFNGPIINAKDFANTYGGTETAYSPASFCMRSDTDSAHNLTPYIRGYSSTNQNIFSTTLSAIFVYPTNSIFSYRHSTSDKAEGFLQKHDTTCKWYYTPAACEDCWYKGKVIKVRVAYKKAAVTYTYPHSEVGTGFYFSNNWTIGSWASHTTEDYDLTIPEGYTRQQLGSTFNVPTVDGYIVTIDDIKFVSVT